MARSICYTVIYGAVVLTCSAVASAAAADACEAGPWVAIKSAAVAEPRTIVLGDGRSVRLAGIESLAALARDTETADAMDARLVDQLAQLLATNSLRIRILPDEADRHGRRAALVLASGKLLQERLLNAGVAVFMPDGFPGDVPDGAGSDMACARQLLAAEAAARLARRGGWSESGFVVVAARPDAILPHFSHFVIFQGIVQSVGTRRDRTYIDFGRHWRSDVTVEITAARRKYFGGEAALEDLAGKFVRVRGFLQEKAGPIVSARYPAQIEVLPDRDAGRH